jgi:hypothetical protein
MTIYIRCLHVGHGIHVGVLVGFGFINIDMQALYVGREDVTVDHSYCTPCGIR